MCAISSCGVSEVMFVIAAVSNGYQTHCGCHEIAGLVVFFVEEIQTLLVGSHFLVWLVPVELSSAFVISSFFGCCWFGCVGLFV